MRVFSSAIVALAVFLLAACNGGDDGPTEPTLPGGRSPAPTAPGDAAPASQLATKFLAGVDGKYVYHYTGPIGQVSEGVLTVYRLGANDRQDWTTSQFGADFTTTSIMAAENNYVCTGGGSVFNCRIAPVAEIEAVRIIASPVFDALAKLVTDPDKFQFEELAEDMFAGITGKCYRAFSQTRIGEGPPSSEEIRTCYTEQGALLHFERTTTPDSASITPSTFSLELQEAAAASPSDFEPTGPVP